MKHLLIAGMIAVAASAASAEPFEFQKRWGSTEYDPFAGTEHLTFAPVEASGKPSSLETWMLEANVDGIALNDFRGTIVKSGPSRISLYEVLRDSPEGIAYRDYHERYPVGTDWDAVARDYRDAMGGEFAAKTTSGRGDS